MPVTYDSLPETEGWTVRPNGRMRLDTDWAPTVGAGAANEDLVPRQYGDRALSAAEAEAACGPAAAVAFARFYGRNPSLREALDLAKNVGWTAAGGMNGIANQARLLDQMQVPHRMTTNVDWRAVIADAQSGNPVTISTPTHYFVIDDFNAQNGTYHVGNSGTAFRAGSPWMTQAQIEALGRGTNGAIFVDHPESPTPSVATAMPVPPIATIREPQNADPLTQIGQRAQQAGLNDEGSRVAMAIASIEGGLTGRVGDPNKGGSFGAFQFNSAGQLPAFARSRNMTPQDAAALLNRDPMAGVDWALSGYLGQAIRDGQQRGLHGSDLATYAQRYGQVSDNPERAGAAYNQFATHDIGGPRPQTTPGAVPVPAPAYIPEPKPMWETYTPEENTGLSQMYQRQFNEAPQWGAPNQDWQQAALGMYRAGQPITTEQNWQQAGNRYEQEFGEPVDWNDYNTDDNTYQYVESALGMSRAGELPDWYEEPDNGDSSQDDEYWGEGQDVGVGADWWDDFTSSGFGQFVGNIPGALGQTFLGAQQDPWQTQRLSPFEEQRIRDEQQQQYGWGSPFDWLGQTAQNAIQGESPLYEPKVLGGVARAAGFVGNLLGGIGEAGNEAYQYGSGVARGLAELPFTPGGEVQTYDWGQLGGQRQTITPRGFGDVFDPAQARARTAAQQSPFTETGLELTADVTGMGKFVGGIQVARKAEEIAQLARPTRYFDVPQELGFKEDIGRLLAVDTTRMLGSGAVGGAIGFLQGDPNNPNDDTLTRLEHGAEGALIGLALGGGAMAAKNWLVHGATDYRSIHYRDVNPGDVEVLRAARVEGDMTGAQTDRLQQLHDDFDQQRSVLRSRYPDYDQLEPGGAIQQRINRDINEELVRDNMPLQMAAQVPATGEYPFLRREVGNFAKSFMDRQAAMGAATDMINAGARSVFGSDVKIIDDPLQMLRALGSTAAEIEDFQRYDVGAAYAKAGLDMTDRRAGEDFNALYKASVAMSRAMGTMEDIPSLISLEEAPVLPLRDRAREAMRAIMGGELPTGEWEPPGFMATGHGAQTPMETMNWFVAEAKRIDKNYGQGAATKWMDGIFSFDDSMADLVRAYEKEGGLAAGEAERVIQSGGVYGFVHALGAQVDETRMGNWMGVGRQMVEDSAIGRSYATDKLVEYGMDSTLRHAGDLITDTKQLRVFNALRNAREQDLGGFANFMRPLKEKVFSENGTELVDDANNTVMRWLDPDEANRKGLVDKGWGLFTGRHNGELETYLMPSDIRDTMITMTPDATSFWLKAIGTISSSSVFRAGVTTASLPFIFANAVRDHQTAFQNTGMPELFYRNLMGATFNAITGGLDDWMRMNPNHPLVKRLPQELSDSIGRIIGGEKGTRAFRREGGNVMLSEVIPGRYAGGKDWLEQTGFVPEGVKGSAIWQTLRTPFDVVKSLAYVSELSTRLAVYNAAIDTGKTAVEAGTVARSTTVDFSRGGEFFKTFGVLMPLVNARLQGTIRSAEALQEDPVGYSHRMMLGAVIPQMLAYAYNKSVYGDLYDDVPQGDKDRNFILGYGVIHDERDRQGKDRLMYMKIPKSEMTALVTNPVEHMLNTVFHVKHGQTDLTDTQRNERSAGQMWLSQLANMLPISMQTQNLADPGAWGASALEMNPLVGTGIQMWANRDSFLDRPIIPEDQMLLPVEYRTGPNGRQAPWGARALSQLTKDLGLPSQLQLAPPQVAFIVSHLGGTAGTMALGATDLIWNAFAKAGAPLPAYQPTSVEDLKLPAGMDPTTKQMYYDAMRQTDIRPWQVQLASRFFGMGGSAQTISAKVNQLSNTEQQIWEQTTGVRNEMDKERNAANDKIDKIMNDPDPNVSFTERRDKVNDIRRGLNEREAALLNDPHYQHALKTPKDRDAFVATLPGVPIDVEKFRPNSANLPANVPVAELVSYWDNPPGVMMDQLDSMAQNQARQQSLANMARQYDVPQSVLRDYIMASKLNNQIPAIPVPAIYMDKLADEYIHPPGDWNPNDADAYYRARRGVVTKAAQDWGVPEQVVLERLQSRLVSSQNMSPIMLSRERALDAYAEMKNKPAFVDPQGNPVGFPEEWPAWEQNITYWRQKEPNRPQLWPEYIRVLDEAQANAKTQQVSALIASPAYGDYQAWFGFGKDLSPTAWAAYQRGENPRYKDSPGVAEENRRDGILRLFQVLPRNSPQRLQMMRDAAQYRRLLTPGWGAAMKLDDLGQPIAGYDDLYQT